MYALRSFVVETHGAQAWHQILSDVGLQSALYLPTKVYPDEDAQKIVASAAELAGTPAQDLLCAFGEFLVPTLMKLYGSLVEPEWKTLELIAHTEKTIHRVLRITGSGAAPPYLRVGMVSEEEVEVIYDSQRRMCAVARGIVHGVAAHYGESVSVHESTCQQRGDAQCCMHVRRSPEGVS